MATIISFVKDDGVFNPKDIRAMSMALDDACKSLNLRDGPQREAIAERIVTLARRGIRSPTVLRDIVLQEVGPAGRVDESDGEGQTA
jgi:hypothetical protein